MKKNRDLTDEQWECIEPLLPPPAKPTFLHRRSNSNISHDEFSKTPGVLCRKPQGAFYVIAKLPVENAEEFVKWLLTDFDVNGETVMLAPAAEFYGTPGKGLDEVRIAYVLNTTALKKAMGILREGLAVYQKQRVRETVKAR